MVSQLQTPNPTSGGCRNSSPTSQPPPPPSPQSKLDRMGKKSKRRAYAATEAPEKETGDERNPAAAGADPGAPRKNRRRGGATAATEIEKEVADRDAELAAPDSEEGKRPKLKKRKNSKQEQSSTVAGRSGKDCSDVQGAPRDAQVSVTPTFAEDSSCPEGNLVQKEAPEGKKPKLKKRNKNKRDQSPSAVSDDGAVVVDLSGNGCTNGQGATGDDEASLSARHGDDPDCPEVNIADKGKPDRKNPKLKKRKKNREESSPSAVVSGKSGNDCTDEEGASRDCEAKMSPRNGGDPDCPQVNIAEMGTPERKKPKLKKQKKNKQERSPSAVPDDGAVEADKYGSVLTNGEGASGDAQVSMSPRNREDPDHLEVNIGEKGTLERKKPKLKKRKKNKQETSPSAVSDVSDVLADKSGYGSTNAEAASQDADVTMTPRSGVDPNIAEDSVEGNKDNFEKSKLKKRKKKKKQERSPSAVLDDGAVEADKSGNVCTDGEGALGDAQVSMSPRSRENPDRLEVNIGEKGTLERKKPKIKKRKKNKQETCPSAVSDASDVLADKSGYGSTNVEAASQDADVTMTPRSAVDPNIAEDSVEGNKDNFEKSKLKKRKKNKQEQSPSAVSDTVAVATDKSGNNCTNEEVAPGDADVSTSPRNGNDPNFPKAPEDLVEEKQGNENNSQKRKRKKKKNMKINQVSVTEEPVVDVLLIGKMDGEIQPDLSEDKKITKSMGPSICESEVTANNVSLTLFQGVETNANAKAVCLRSDKSDFIPKAFTSGGNHKEKVRDVYSPRGSLVRFQRKKLLILDLNGLLADINQDHHNAHMSHARVRGKLVFKRPYCDDFLRFCFQNFELGIWSSRMKANVDSVVNILMKDLKQHLLFCWDLSKCTTTGCNTLENQYKPLVLKELKKLWNKEEPGLPWEQGEFSPLNTLLVDDSPYKALRNPPHTAIFPHPYSYHNKTDDSLGPGGDLRVYLENIAAADCVQSYVQDHPFGQPSIVESDPHWNFYVQILDKLGKPVA